MLIYRLRMIDTGGDGWQSATYKLYNSTSLADTLERTVAASGTLGDGFEGSDWICLADGCYEIVVGGGSADSEVGFEFYDEVRRGFLALPSRYHNDGIVMYVDLLSCFARGSTGRRPLSRPRRTVLGPPLRRARRRLRPSDSLAEHFAPALARPIADADVRADAWAELPADCHADIGPYSVADATPDRHTVVTAVDRAVACAKPVSNGYADCVADAAAVAAPDRASDNAPDAAPDDAPDAAADAAAHRPG